MLKYSKNNDKGLLSVLERLVEARTVEGVTELLKNNR